MTPISDITIAPSIRRRFSLFTFHFSLFTAVLRLIFGLIIAFAVAAFFLAPWLTEGK